MNIISSFDSFNLVINWINNEVITRRKAPGLLVGLSGTDSVIAFMACYAALDKADKANRLMGVHFVPSEDFLYDHPEAEVHTWFAKEIVPWLKEKCPKAQILINDSIDWRMDGVRWGMLCEIASVDMSRDGRVMRPSEEKNWVVGTRNKTENVLGTYSNASMMASIQPIIKLWKTDILDLLGILGAPPILTGKSCEMDCICGRERFPANYPKEIDAIIQYKLNENNIDKWIKYDGIPSYLKLKLENYINSKIQKNKFKNEIPYRPDRSV